MDSFVILGDNHELRCSEPVNGESATYHIFYISALIIHLRILGAFIIFFLRRY
jgi:hypothetical protein